MSKSVNFSGQPIKQTRFKAQMAFSNMVSIIRQQFMVYINIYSFLEDNEKAWRITITTNKDKSQNSLFPEMRGLTFENEKMQFCVSVN